MAEGGGKCAKESVVYRLFTHRVRPSEPGPHVVVTVVIDHVVRELFVVAANNTFIQRSIFMRINNSQSA